MNLNNIFLFILSVAEGGALSSIRLPTERVPPQEIPLHTLSFPFSFLCILYSAFSFSIISFLYMFM